MLLSVLKQPAVGRDRARVRRKCTHGARTDDQESAIWCNGAVIRFMCAWWCKKDICTAKDRAFDPNELHQDLASTKVGSSLAMHKHGESCEMSAGAIANSKRGNKSYVC